MAEMRQDACVLNLEKAMQGRKWIDQSGYGNNGAMTGAHFKESSVYFDGVDDRVNIGKPSAILVTEAITVEILMNTRSMADYSIPFTHGHNAENGWYLITYTDGHAKFTLRGVASKVEVISAPGFYTLNKWHHLVGRYESGVGGKLFLDGVEIATTGNGGDIIQSAHDCYIAYYPVSELFYRGRVALARIYNKALSTQQIKELYEQTYRLI